MLMYPLKTFYNFHPSIISNGIHTSNILNSSRQIGNAMRKVLGTTKKKKFHYEELPKLQTPNLLSEGSVEGKSSRNSRRVSILNKLFMRHITDQISSGECASMVFGHGIEIHKVKITPDFKTLRVYWTAKASEEVESVLQKCAGLLRHELSQLRVMGNVPMIRFIKDKNYALLVELDNRLAIADFGEGHTPPCPADKYKTELEVSVPLAKDIKEKLKELETQETEEFDDLPLPLMPQNVLGLPHADILRRVKLSLNKSRAIHRNKNEDEDMNQENWAVSQSVNEDPLLRQKARQTYLDNEHDLEYTFEELFDNNESHLSKFNMADDEDYIIEDIDDKN
ncbi:hypothetical protein NQ318_022792 [Aromia moschata]|uniref:Ribosome-binding factor A, mitochondrial n=1 Tax=Aromia moschata TaxID=1265417 RepID=A0AAV8YE59_9CUCU|nr:hypothetical protein NQ318_022792 [Aromia moschata]